MTVQRYKKIMNHLSLNRIISDVGINFFTFHSSLFTLFRTFAQIIKNKV